LSFKTGKRGAMWLSPLIAASAKQPRVARFGQVHDGCDIADVVRDVFDIEALAVGFATPAQVQGEHGQAGCSELRPDP